MSSNRCFLCEGRHLADECTTYRTLEERENAVETLKLCLHCLQPKAPAHLHHRAGCMHCGKGHHPALCPLEPRRRGITCAFCLEYHHSDACDKYRRLEDRLRAVEVLKICRRCLSRSHLEGDCPSMHRCKACKERHHHTLCPTRGEARRGRIRSISPLRQGPTKAPHESRKKKYVAENDAGDDSDEIEVIGVVQGSKSNAKKSSKEKTKKSSSSSEYRKQVDKLKAEVNKGRRELRLAKEDKRRAERERDSARKERDDAQDKCKALEKKIHDLEEENRNCEAIRQVTAAAVEASIEIVTNREEERRRTIEQERDHVKKKLLEAEKRIEAFKRAASEAIRLTSEFQAWRIRAALKARKSAVLRDNANNSVEDASTLPENVAADVQKAVKETAAEENNGRKRRAAPSAAEGKRHRTDSVKPSAGELRQKLDAVLGGYSEVIAEKYKLFFVENLRGVVTIEALVDFVRQRCPDDVELANDVFKCFSKAP